MDAVFPTAIVISVDSRTVSVEGHTPGVVKVSLSEYTDPESPELTIAYRDIASIIDGQHRLKAFEDYDGSRFDINIAMFVDIDDAREAEIFSTVNLAQTKVNRS